MLCRMLSAFLVVFLSVVLPGEVDRPTSQMRGWCAAQRMARVSSRPGSQSSQMDIFCWGECINQRDNLSSGYMRSDQSEGDIPRKCIFYFKYEMKIEFIPHIEEEIEEFLSVCQQKVQYPQYKQHIVFMINKRINDIDRFFHRNWNDYRIQLLLRSRKLLVDFTKQYHQFLATHNDDSQQAPWASNDEPKSSVGNKQLSKSHSKQAQLDKGSKQKYKEVRNIVEKKKSKVIGHIGSDKLQPAVLNEANGYSRSPSGKVSSPVVVHAKKSSGNIVNFGLKVGGEISQANQRVKSTSSDHSKLPSKSSKVIGAISPGTKKMTKEQYIAYLKNKKAN